MIWSSPFIKRAVMTLLLLLLFIYSHHIEHTHWWTLTSSQDLRLGLGTSHYGTPTPKNNIICDMSTVWFPWGFASFGTYEIGAWDVVWSCPSGCYILKLMNHVNWTRVDQPITHWLPMIEQFFVFYHMWFILNDLKCCGSVISSTRNHHLWNAKEKRVMKK
jgi:hypothetical protein